MHTPSCSNLHSRVLLAAPHHQFAVDGDSYFFATDSLHVLRSDPLTQAIMRRAGGAEIAASRETSFDTEEIKEQTEKLHRLGFLRYPGEAMTKLEVEPGTAVTFMINVSQRCNLTCSYCYVNEGQFDYPEKPIKRMKRETFEGWYRRQDLRACSPLTGAIRLSLLRRRAVDEFPGHRDRSWPRSVGACAAATRCRGRISTSPPTAR